MRKKIFSLLLCTLLPSSLLATSAIAPTLDDLVHAAQKIVYAEVEKISSHYEPIYSEEMKKILKNSHRQLIISKITLKPIRSYKGNLNDTFSLTQLGGCVLNECMSSSLDPVFRSGERAIFFLEKNESAELQSVMGEYSIFKVDKNEQQIIGLEESLKDFEKKLIQKVEGEKSKKSHL